MDFPDEKLEKTFFFLAITRQSDASGGLEDSDR